MVNIFFSFALKGGSIIIQLILVSVTIDYLDKFQYGIWLTLASVIGWFSFFDIGVGNGLRNKLAIALQAGDYEMGRVYVSTAYFFLTIIFTAISIVFLIVNSFLNWSILLNVPQYLNQELSELVNCVFVFFSIRFILSLITNILLADQKSAISNLITFLANCLSLLAIIFVREFRHGSVFLVGIIYSGVPLIVMMLFNMLFFMKRYRNISPSINYVQIRHLKGLLELGGKFFVIQFAAVVLFTTSNVMLAQWYGPEQVTSYNIAYRYFTTVSMFLGIIINPIWSAITQAYYNNEWDWIRGMMRKLNFISYGLVVISILMYFFANSVYRIWVGNSVEVPDSINLIMLIFVIATLVGLPANTFVNGVGKIKLQYYTAFFSLILTIPFAYFFSHILRMGPAGVILAPLLTTVPTSILWRIQYKKLICGSAKGIWSR